MGSSTPRIGTQRYRPCEGAHAATHFHIHSYARMYTPTHTSRCTHADTATRALTQVHVPRHSALSPVRKYSASLALSLHPSIPSIHSLISWFLSVCQDFAKATDRRCEWLGRGYGSGGQTSAPGAGKGAGKGRAPGAGGRRSRPSSAQSGRGSRQMRSPQPGPAERLSAESPRRPEEEIAAAPR